MCKPQPQEFHLIGTALDAGGGYPARSFVALSSETLIVGGSLAFGLLVMMAGASYERRGLREDASD